MHNFLVFGAFLALVDGDDGVVEVSADSLEDDAVITEVVEGREQKYFFS